jgi:outer membrane receptor protein involved in Fe transport
VFGPDDQYGVALFVNNLFDKFYATGGSVTGTLGKYYILGTPRIIGREVSVKL